MTAAMIMKKLYLLLLIVTIVSLPASAQVSLSGVWDNLGTGDSFDKVLNSSVIHEDWPDRLFGPELGDYTGIPLTDAARMRADSGKVFVRVMLATERARVLINQTGAQRGQRHEWFYGRAWSERVCESHVGIDDSTHAARS